MSKTVLKCKKHPNQNALYICTYPQCSDNLPCPSCVPSHNMHHLSRLLLLENAFTNEDSLLNTVKAKQMSLINHLKNIVKSKELGIERIFKSIGECFEIVTKEALNMLEELKRDTINEFKEYINKDNETDKQLEELWKNLENITFQEEEDTMSIVKNIQILEDNIIPSTNFLLNDLKLYNSEENIQNNQLLLSNFRKELLQSFTIIKKNMKNSISFDSDHFKFQELIKNSLNLNLVIPSKDLVISQPMKLEPDFFQSFNRIIIENGGILTVDPWDGERGGRLLLFCDLLVIKQFGIIDVSGLGYRGGLPCNNDQMTKQSNSGESYSGVGNPSNEPNFGGGGGGLQNKSDSSGGGGGGYGTAGLNGEFSNHINNGVGKGGLCYGNQDMNVIYLGSGGGAGAPGIDGGNEGRGGNGGGAIFIITKEFHNEGKILANGEDGEDANIDCVGGGGGGGSGGSVFVKALEIYNKGEIIVNGGDYGIRGQKLCFNRSNGGKGGLGRIKIQKDFEIQKINIFGIDLN